MKSLKQNSLLLLLMIFIGSSTYATTRYVKHDATGANNGTSWTDAYTDLQVAMNAAAVGDEIWVAAGTYKPTQKPTGVNTTDDRDKTFFLNKNIKIYGGFVGTERLLSQRNGSKNVTILSGDIGNVGDDSDNCYHVFITAKLTDETVIDGFTITEGNGSNVSKNPFYIVYEKADFFKSYGGGFYNNVASSPKLVNIMFLKNKAKWGGGIYNSSYAAPNLVGVTITKNIANEGGGIFNNGNAAPVLTDVLITRNTATGNGGGLCNYNALPVFENVIVTKNIAHWKGGGVYNQKETSVAINSGLTELDNINFAVDEHSAPVTNNQTANINNHRPQVNLPSDSSIIFLNHANMNDMDNEKATKHISFPVKSFGFFKFKQSNRFLDEIDSLETVTKLIYNNTRIPRRVQTRGDSLSLLSFLQERKATLRDLIPARNYRGVYFGLNIGGGSNPSVQLIPQWSSRTTCDCDGLPVTTYTDDIKENKSGSIFSPYVEFRPFNKLGIHTSYHNIKSNVRHYYLLNEETRIDSDDDRNLSDIRVKENRYDVSARFYALSKFSNVQFYGGLGVRFYQTNITVPDKYKNNVRFFEPVSPNKFQQSPLIVLGMAAGGKIPVATEMVFSGAAFHLTMSIAIQSTTSAVKQYNEKRMKQKEMYWSIKDNYNSLNYQLYPPVDSGSDYSSDYSSWDSDSGSSDSSSSSSGSSCGSTNDN